jgi:hypothetical protein
MGKDSRSSNLAQTSNTASNQYSQLAGSQTPLEKEMIPQSQEMWNTYMTGKGQNLEDYSNIMGGYQNFANNLSAPTKFTPQMVGASGVGAQNVSAQNVGTNFGDPTKFNFQNVNVNNPAEMATAYGYLNQAAPGYQNFADTGGYSPTDIQELRARGVSPIRSAYSNSMMELDRARALGGSAGSPNYIAALSRMQRELPGQMADATTGVNASLADAVRQGKLSGLAGLTGIGSTMGGLAGAESGRNLQASLANQGADITTQGMTEQSLQANFANRLKAEMANQGANLQAGMSNQDANLRAGMANQSAGLQAALANQGVDLQAQGMTENSLQAQRAAQLSALSGQNSLYGTTPGMASTFGNQALNSYGQRLNLEQMRNQQGLGLINAQIQGTSAQTPQKPLWQQILSGMGSAIPYIGGMFGGGGIDQSVGNTAVANLPSGNDPYSNMPGLW